MSRTAHQPWGFRLHGGVDFASVLTVLKVNGGSVAESAGLVAGDSILKLNAMDMRPLRHQEALDAISRAGNVFQLTVARAVVWKPLVTPLSQPVPIETGDRLLTKTSLALRHEESLNIGSAHNAKAAPFGAGKPVLVNQQFNSPLRLYSDKNIADTLTAQAEVLAQGVVGVNFMKNEKAYDSTKSEVFKMLQEFDNDPQEEPAPAPAPPASHPVSSPFPIQIVRQVPVPAPAPVPAPQTPAPVEIVHKIEVAAPCSVKTVAKPAGVRSVAAPVTKAPSKEPLATADNPRCSECDRFIVGVFVRLKGMNLHVECFKCATCGTSLKNVGYYKINEKLYCDIHARQVASAQPPAPHVAAVTVNPGDAIPRGAMTTEAVAQQLGASLAALSTAARPAGGVRMFPLAPPSGPQPFFSRPAH